MGDLYFKLGEFDQATIYYEKLLSIVSDSLATVRLSEIKKKTQNAYVLHEQGLNALRKGNFKTAKTLFTKAIKEKSNFKEAQYHLLLAVGSLSYKMATKKSCWDAIEAFGKAAAIRSETAEPHYRMARAYERKDPNEFVNAIEEYEMALRLEPEGPFANECKKKIRELKTRKEKLDKFWGRKK